MEPFQAKFFPGVLETTSDPNASNYCGYNDHMLSLAGSIVYATGAVAALFSGWLAQSYGRKWSFWSACFTVILGSLLSAFATGLTMLMFGRAIVGVGFGFVGHIVPLYLSEGERRLSAERLLTAAAQGEARAAIRCRQLPHASLLPATTAVSPPKIRGGCTIMYNLSIQVREGGGRRAGQPGDCSRCRRCVVHLLPVHRHFLSPLRVSCRAAC